MSVKKWWVMVLLAILTLSLGLIGGCVSYQDTKSEEPVITLVTPAVAYSLIEENKANPDFIILDVRTPEEYADGYIAESIPLDFYADDFEAELDKLDKNKTYLVYCRSGNRSGKSVKMMKDLNFREVYDVDGGILRWEAAGFPMVR
jgi:rhodanese-related sulfurtransferase